MCKFENFRGLLLLFVVLFSCCGEHKDANKRKDNSGLSVPDTVGAGAKALKAKMDGSETRFDKVDTTILIFGDSSYLLSIHMVGLPVDYEFDSNKKNGTLVLYKYTNRKKEIVLSDSLHCSSDPIYFEDFNNDGIKDITLFYETVARGNYTYYLYLVDPKNKKLIRVKGFEEIPNPSLDSVNNIIKGLMVSGDWYYSFYYINSDNQLINLGHEVDAAEDEADVACKKAIKAILKERRKAKIN